MATMKFKGLDDYIKKLERLSNNAEATIKKALYKGAGVAADSIKSSIEGINTDDRPHTGNEMRTGPTTIQKIGLVRSFGISPMKTKAGTIDVKLGFDGYNAVRSERWPKGQPNVMIARSVESGTSWMQKQPFMRKAERQAKALVELEIKKTLEEEIAKIIK